ncbi:hypothetical protein L2E82_10499 [Cichorium intybus]|uniref:Uncharacterized protein n=1 Tax=Cichorium intybus TaxID=13427 RepID=A0ACB9GAL8_CICIN|nr:hypothetical protein L2E82_10499 [Cichorium intybus]
MPSLPSLLIIHYFSFSLKKRSRLKDRGWSTTRQPQGFLLQNREACPLYQKLYSYCQIPRSLSFLSRSTDARRKCSNDTTMRENNKLGSK